MAKVMASRWSSWLRAPPAAPGGAAPRSHLDRPQLAGAALEVAHGLATVGDERPLDDVRAHGAQQVEHPAPRRVDADPLEHELRIGVGRAGHEPEGGRGDVARDPLIDRSHRLPALHADDHRTARPGHLARHGPAARPASRTADFTWALGTGVAWSIGRSGRRPVTDRGGSVSSARAWSVAPIARSGSMIRATGRRRNESSPSRIVASGVPARMPA